MSGNTVIGAKRFDLDWSDHISEKSRICVFVGAGVSVGATTDSGLRPPNWEGLIEILEEKFGIDQNEGIGDLELRERAELIEVERLKKRISKHGFLRLVESIVDNLNGQLVKKTSVHDTLVEINPQLIVTTNYDRIIERHMNGGGNGGGDVGYNVWTYPGRVEQVAAQSACSEQDSLGDFLRSGEPLIVKIHGGIDSTSGIVADFGSTLEGDYSLVFSDSSYYEAYRPEGEMPAFLRAVFSTFQVIFIGYSLRDQVLRDILQSSAVLKGSRFRHVILQGPESVVPNSYRDSFEEMYGVKVGTYTEHGKLSASLHAILLSRD